MSCSIKYLGGGKKKEKGKIGFRLGVRTQVRFGVSHPGHDCPAEQMRVSIG